MEREYTFELRKRKLNSWTSLPDSNIFYYSEPSHTISKFSHELTNTNDGNMFTEYCEAKEVVSRLLQEGRLTTSYLEGKVFEFGADDMGASVYLAQHAKELVVNDLCLPKIDSVSHFFKTYPILKEEDGFEALKNYSAHFDLIVSFYFWFWDTPKEEVNNFVESSKAAVRKNGRILVTSDFRTMDKVHESFSSQSDIREITGQYESIKPSTHVRVYERV
jgi:hypothetical protein